MSDRAWMESVGYLYEVDGHELAMKVGRVIDLHRGGSSQPPHWNLMHDEIRTIVG